MLRGVAFSNSKLTRSIGQVQLQEKGVSRYDEDYAVQYEQWLADTFPREESLTDSLIEALYQDFLDYEYQEPPEDIYYAKRDASGQELLSYKTGEIYNEKLVALWPQKVGNQLNVSFSFTVEPLAKDGSEDKAFGVDGDEIQRGIMNTSGQLLSTVTFDGSKDLYDEILIEAMQEGPWEIDAEKPLRDGRELLTHTLVFDQGQLDASDDSQHSEGAARGSDAWPGGQHCLLEVCDSLGLYDLLWPEWSYVRTFNLHLNPAVLYIVNCVKAEVISDATYDANGRLLTVSKPLVGPTELQGGIVDKIQKTLPASMGPGVYRYKLTETAISPETLPSGDRFDTPTEAKIVDISLDKEGQIIDFQIFNSPEQANAYQANYDKREDADFIPTYCHTEFTNPLNPEDVPFEKKINEQDVLAVENIYAPFTFTITGTIPAGGKAFFIQDHMPEQLEFADTATTVTLGSTTLSEADTAKIVEREGNSLYVTLTEEQVSAYEGQQVSVAFRAQVKDSCTEADVEKGIVNLAEGWVNNIKLESDVDHQAKLTVKEEEPTVTEARTKTTPQADTPVANPPHTKEKAVKTGDETAYLGALGLLLLSLIWLKAGRPQRRRG